MIRSALRVGAIAAIALGFAELGCATGLPRPTAANTSRTHWKLEASEAFDALCMLNLLREDPFYTQFFKDKPQALYVERMGPTEKTALVHLEKRVKVDGGGIVSARLTLAFSGVPVATLDDLLSTVQSDAAWARARLAFLSSPQGRGIDFADLEDVRPDLVVLLSFLKREGFSGRWRRDRLPEIERYIAQNRPTFELYDVVRFDEEITGHSLGTGEITAYVLAYAKPHGIRLQGWKFITAIAWPVSITVKTALHELLHPPFERSGRIAEHLSSLEQDPFFQRLLNEHNPDFGYRSADDFTEEDCAEAVDVFNSERMGLLRAPDGAPTAGAKFFSQHDDGMHVLAFIVYEQLRVADRSHWTTYEDFLEQLFARGVLGRGTLQRQFESYPDHYPVAALTPAR